MASCFSIVLSAKHCVMCFILSCSFVEIECAAHADLSSMLYTCASQIDPIALPCLSPIHCFESGANIRGTAVLRGRAESKKGSSRMVLTTKAAYTKASELLIRQFLCPRHGTHDDVKLAVLYRHRRPAGRSILRLVPIDYWMGFLWSDLPYQPRGKTFSHSLFLLFLSLIISMRMTMWPPRCLSSPTSGNLITNPRYAFQ